MTGARYLQIAKIPGTWEFPPGRFFLFSEYLQSRRMQPLPQSTIAFHKEKHIMGFSNE